MFINDEVPTWAINGVNRVYQTLNTPSKMVAVIVDGADYKDYSLYTNILTLTDAPTASIYIDYFYGVTPTPTTSDVTLGDISDKVYSLLGQRPTSTTFSQPIVTQTTNNIIRTLCKGRYKSPTGQAFRCGKLWFMEGSYPIRIQGESTLGAQYNVWDSTITCDTTNLLSSWYLQIWGEIITYTSKTSTELQGVTGATIAHLENEAIVQLYNTPLAMLKPQSVSLILQNKYLSEMDIPLDYDGQYSVRYEILRIGSKQLMKIVWIQKDRIVEVKYTKVVDNLSADTDLCILPEDYGITVVAYLVAGQLGIEKGMPNAQEHLAFGTSNLQIMFGDFSNIKTITRQKLSPAPYSRI